MRAVSPGLGRTGVSPERIRHRRGRCSWLGRVTTPLHADELPIDMAVVAALVDRDLPEYAHLALRPLASTGSSNALFRLGDELLLRLPRQRGGGATIAKELRWVPVVAPALPVDVPRIVMVGQPGFGYPERWCATRWLDGNPAMPPVSDAGPGAESSAELADALADVVRGLRSVPVTAAAGADPELRWYRGQPLAERDTDTRHFLAQCRQLDGLELDLDAAEGIWTDAMALPGADRTAAPRWYHGDLVAENLLVVDGRLRAVLDFGALSVGDPTVDLHGAWEVLDAAGRARFRSRLGVEDAEWLRGRAWALSIAVMTFPYYWHTMPQRCASRLVMARAVLADARCSG